MDLIDCHCHLTSGELLEDVSGVLTRARAAGVGRVITVATDLADARAAAELARQHSNVYLSAGIHPHESARAGPEDIADLCTLLNTTQAVAIGETGLDYHYDFSDRQSQRSVFSEQLELARQCDLPVVIHCREALDETIAILRNAGMEGRKVVFHCFSGDAKGAARIADHGWRVSFTGIVTFKNAKPVQDVARSYPNDHIMIETDAPYLSPVPVRHVRPCEPAFVAHILNFLADLRKQSPEELALHCTANTVDFFNLS